MMASYLLHCQMFSDCVKIYETDLSSPLETEIKSKMLELPIVL